VFLKGFSENCMKGLTSQESQRDQWDRTVGPRIPELGVEEGFSH